MDTKWQLGKDAIDELYNQKFKKFLYYHWIQSFIIFNYNICTHKKGRFLQAPRSCNLLYIPITCTWTIDQNLVWLNFEEFYAFITSSKQLKAYAFHTYLNLSHSLEMCLKT